LTLKLFLTSNEILKRLNRNAVITHLGENKLHYFEEIIIYDCISGISENMGKAEDITGETLSPCLL
jgi:hypothetical protein